MDVNPQTLDSFEQWKEYLSGNVNIARSTGASEQTIVEVATRMGDFLANKVDPANREQRLLKELWDKGDDSERKALAKMITKMVSDGEKSPTRAH